MPWMSATHCVPCSRREQASVSDFLATDSRTKIIRGAGSNGIILFSALLNELENQATAPNRNRLYRCGCFSYGKGAVHRVISKRNHVSRV